MRISEKDFQFGGEIDYHARWKARHPLLREVEGRLSLRKNGRDYQFYLTLPQDGNKIPRVELILWESPSLKDAVFWGNVVVHEDKFYDDYDGYEDCLFLGEEKGRPACCASDPGNAPKCRFCSCTVKS